MSPPSSAIISASLRAISSRKFCQRRARTHENKKKRNKHAVVRGEDELSDQRKWKRRKNRRTKRERERERERESESESE